MVPEITENIRASQAFIQAVRRTEDMVFSPDEIIISDKKKMGDPVVCTIEAQKGNGESSQVTGIAYIYPDLVNVCIESVLKKFRDPTYPHHYEYLSY